MQMLNSQRLCYLVFDGAIHWVNNVNISLSFPGCRVSLYKSLCFLVIYVNCKAHAICSFLQLKSLWQASILQSIESSSVIPTSNLLYSFIFNRQDWSLLVWHVDFEVLIGLQNHLGQGQQFLQHLLLFVFKLISVT